MVYIKYRENFCAKKDLKSKIEQDWFIKRVLYTTAGQNIHVYFDQHLGAAHYKHWVKSVLNMFFHTLSQDFDARTKKPDYFD